MAKGFSGVLFVVGNLDQMLGELMEREITEQPRLLCGHSERYYDTLRSILDGVKPDLILLVARGSSDNAALFARYLIEIHLGIPVSLAAPSVLTRYHRHVKYKNCLAIGISQSGAAPDVAEVLLALQESGNTALAITNTVPSRLANEVAHVLPLEVGLELSVAATKTYSASLLALCQIVRALGGDLPDPTSLLPDEAWNTACRAVAFADGIRFAESSPQFSLGRGYGFSTANEAALKLMECALIPAKAYSTADFEHGPKALAGPGSGLLLFDEAPASVIAQGGDFTYAPVPPEYVPETLHPIWQILYAQWLALACARLKNLDPDNPQFIQKVTRTI
jgi:glutamine---fructose-6-phosphate transaminase (isomerizing)